MADGEPAGHGGENGTLYSFLAIHGTATMRFDVAEDEVFGIVAKAEQMAAGDASVRPALREMVRTGFLDGAHLHPARSQPIASAVVYLCMTSQTREANPAARGFMLLMSPKPDGSTNFRFIAAPDRTVVDEFTSKAREGLNYVAAVTPEQAARAVARKRTAPSRDPSLDPPPKPRPDRWLPSLEAAEKVLGRNALEDARRCLEAGAMFVWKSRQIADAAQEEIDASLQAMSEYDRLHLPFPTVWAETRDWIEVPRHDAAAERVPCRFAVAASEVDGTIAYWSFADFGGHMSMSLLCGTVDRQLLSGGRRHFMFDRPVLLTRPDAWDEAAHRRIARACGDRLLELLFLLSTQGVARDKVTESNGKPGKKRQAQRRMSARDYTVIRVPMVYSPASPGNTDASGEERWVRPHARRAHMWGVNTRTPERQQWRDACLVGAVRIAGDEEASSSRPNYRIL